MNKQLEQIISEYKRRTEQLCCVVDVKEDIPHILDNKIGGMPYIPKGETYPLDSDGNPMALILQIACKDIECLPNIPFNGIIEIFAKSKLEWPWEYTILYFPEGMEYRTDLPELNLKDFICTRGFKIDLTQGIAHMPLYDYRSDGILSEITKQITGKEINSWFDLNTLFSSRNHDDEATFLFAESLTTNRITIGGYADFTQEDIRPREAKGMDICLFKLDSCADLKKFNIGDAGILSVLISETDLINRAFNKAVLTWDCC